MRKIPTLFLRDAEDMRRVTRAVHPACAWVLAGEGIPTRKFDGTCVRMDEATGGETPAGTAGSPEPSAAGYMRVPLFVRRAADDLPYAATG